MSMQDELEVFIRDRMLALDEMEDIKVFYRGEPGIVPVSLFPMGIVFMNSTAEATSGVEGYGPSTQTKFWRHEGYIAFEVVFLDAVTIAPDEDRKADVGSYLQAKDFVQACLDSLRLWDLDEETVELDDERTTGELYLDRIENALVQRSDNASNRGSVRFHLYTQQFV